MIRIFVVSFIAVFFTAITVRTPKNFIPICALLGGLAAVLFTALAEVVDYQMIPYFITTFFITVCSEILARLKKTPAIVFTVPAIFAILPGLKIYTAMANLVLNTGDASTALVDSLLAILGMAMAMVLTSIFAKPIHRFISLLLRRKKTTK